MPVTRKEGRKEGNGWADMYTGMGGIYIYGIKIKLERELWDAFWDVPVSVNRNESNQEGNGS